ncbi:MAG: hypothetical protein JSV10_07405 [Candidatus Zixiibacteriota bacterium]|nr:MAG: hypothetical protein JSV10_07405 [candidate division Zixibacteria bacterium]
MKLVLPVRLGLTVLLSLLLAAYCCVSGCKNPFRTRSSPPPELREGTWETPALPETVIENLLNAYRERVIDNFAECLSDSFRFSAPEDSIDAANYGLPWLFEGWDRDVEIRVTDNIFKTVRQNPDSSDYDLYLHLTSPNRDEENDTLAVLYRDYELYVYNLKAFPPETTLAKGTAAFHMRQSSLNWWSIYFWSDIPAAAGEDDWADFKAAFRQ